MFFLLKPSLMGKGMEKPPLSSIGVGWRDKSGKDFFFFLDNLQEHPGNGKGIGGQESGESWNFLGADIK